MNALIPSSFVLADLFDVAVHSLKIPDHVIENDASFDFVNCPVCDGEKKVLSTADTVIGCPRCNEQGEILDTVELTAVSEVEAVVLREAA